MPLVFKWNAKLLNSGKNRKIVRSARHPWRNRGLEIELAGLQGSSLLILPVAQTAGSTRFCPKTLPSQNPELRKLSRTFAAPNLFIGRFLRPGGDPLVKTIN